MTKFLKISAVILSIIVTILAAFYLAFLIITKGAHLDGSKLISADSAIMVFDADDKEIASATISNKRKSVEIGKLQPYTVNAFVASEDRTFYSHHGLNYKRMLKAAYKNIISHSFKEGASTISQQLVKNTHLSGDKTITRKLKEIKLTKVLEKNYSKDEILEMYLNTIYFGHNCFGLQSASEFYFNKNAEELSLDESAVLVGLLSSPNNYSPFKNPEKSTLRRNIVLKAMYDCGYITHEQYLECSNLPLNVVKTTEKGKNSDYLSAVFDELEDTDLNFYKLTEGCKIYTYLDCEIQNFIENLEYPCDNAVILTDNSGGVCAYKSTVGSVKRQPGSTIKPFAVYAPAIEEKLVSPHTKILDESVNYDGYSPENYDKKYHGYVTMTDCLKMSYNVPAVKTLNALTLERAEKYLTAMNIKLEDGEKNLSLALGGMKHGMTLKHIADCYTTFANSGIYSSSRFIRKIQSQDGTTLYESNSLPSRVFSEGTCSLMNDILLETTKSGTAKKLKDLNYEVASKTGTCGNESGNTDAYSVNYTNEHCIGVWLGDRNNTRLKVTGGNDCCKISKQILKKLYHNHAPLALEKDNGTQKVEIDAEEYYENNKVILIDSISPKLNNLSVKVLTGNIPKEISTRFTNPTVSKPAISVKNNAVNIELCHTKYYSYIVKRYINGKNQVIFDGKWKKIITDSPGNGIFTYSLIPYYFDGVTKHFGQELILPPVKIGTDSSKPQVKIPEIINSDWYNL